MKVSSIKNLVITIMVLSTNYSVADVKTKEAGTIQIINKSNAPIAVILTERKDNHQTDAANPSGIIAAGATGIINYSNKDNFKNFTIQYFKSDNKTPLDLASDGKTPILISFDPISVPVSIYVYGNSDIAAGNLDTTVAATPVPSRSVAVWTGVIPAADLGASATAATALADASIPVSATNSSGILTMYMISVDGKNSTLVF